MVEPASPEVQQSPRHTIVSVGGSVNITCSTSAPTKGLFLKQTWPKTMNVIYYEDEMNATVDEQFWDRVSFMGSQDNLSITVNHLQLADSGVYICSAVAIDSESSGSGTMVMVTEKLYQETQEPHKHQDPGPKVLVLPWALAGGCFLLGLGLGMLYALRTQIRNSCASRDKNPVYVVYEDMSYSSRNMLSTPTKC
ncbi:T-cell antigen CD7 isoform X2 [Cavia porcellus]|uniref:T-cell antigen CD7 isoform X2 n=1 Tax=Cavia porcellus TaxID=10141 RepID=UPI002FE1730B